MNVISLPHTRLLFIESTLNFEVSILTLLSSYSAINDIHLSFKIINYYFITNHLLTNKTTFLKHRYIKKISIRSNSHTLPSILLNELYQHEGWYKLLIDMISDTNALHVFVNENKHQR